MVGLMRGYAIGLGIRCHHCHVGEGDDPSTFDFASDAKPAKTLARQMMRMTNETGGYGRSTGFDGRPEGIKTTTAGGRDLLTASEIGRGSG
jgi:hypothetical protein